MIKVFLVEDESLIREGIRDIIQWEQLGFEFAGEAGDGEIALPMIRNVKPDVLITDIKMPFMDGLDLSRIVSKEMPDTKIIIISGHDDFEYARQAIELHVDKYLLKPITRLELTDTLKTVREQIIQEREQKDYLHKFNKEVQEYEMYSRRKFFENMVTGSLSVNELYKTAEELNIDLTAESYNIVLFIPQGRIDDSSSSEKIMAIHEALTQSLEGDSRYFLVRWNMISFALLIKSSLADIDSATKHCVDIISKQCENIKVTTEWYVASGTPVNRLSAMASCFSETNHYLSFRHLHPGEHIFTSSILEKRITDSGEEQLNDIDVNMVDPAVIKSFLQTGLKDEIDDFLNDYLNNLAGAVNSIMFRNYMVLNTRYLSAIFVKGIGYDYEEFLNELPNVGMDISVEGTKTYMEEILKKAIELRDAEAVKQSKTVINDACRYIDEHYSDDSISLIVLSNHVNISPNYFSAMFSQEMGLTFVEYLTKKRMDKAKELLRLTGLRSGEIAEKIGYRDPRYFSFLFKKMVGLTPRDYRAEVNKQS